jgi:restriction system protein
VKWVQTIPRDSLSTATRNTLGAILTLFEISDTAKEEIERVLKGAQHEIAAVDEHESITELSEDMFDRSLEFIKDGVLGLDERQLPELVAGLLRAMGYRTRVSPPGSDLGKDIYASPDGLWLEEPRIAVEVKARRNSQMGAPEVRSFAGGLRGTKGVYVSTGGFSKEAHYEAARTETPVVLLDAGGLASLVTQYYDDCDTDTQALLPLRKLYWRVK